MPGHRYDPALRAAAFDAFARGDAAPLVAEALDVAPHTVDRWRREWLAREGDECDTLQVLDRFPAPHRKRLPPGMAPPLSARERDEQRRSAWRAADAAMQRPYRGASPMGEGLGGE